MQESATPLEDASPMVVDEREDVAPSHAELQAGVKLAVESLGGGLTAHPRNAHLRDQLASGALDLKEFYRQLLHVAFRLLFLFIAEDRDLLHQTSQHHDGDSAQARHLSDCSIDCMRQIAADPDRATESDLWELFTQVTRAISGDVEVADFRHDMGLPTLGGFLFDLRATLAINGPGQHRGRPAYLFNRDFLRAVRHLTYVDRGQSTRPIDYGGIETQALGAMYESLLDLHPAIEAEAGTFVLQSMGSERKVSGSYYTPESLIQHLLDSALEPVVEGRLLGLRTQEERERVLLETTVCDPTVGSGHFLVAAAHRLARHLVRIREGDEHDSEAASENYQQALRDVITRCLYGVDINPMAVELCKIALWFESKTPGLPLTFLDHHIRCGNALLGAGADVIGPNTDLNELLRLADAWCAQFIEVSTERRGIEARTHPFFHWPLEFPEVFLSSGGFDVIIGNPPFLNQMESATANGKGITDLLRARTEDVVRGYADCATAILHLSCELLREGGRMALVQPQSMLVTRDAARVRTSLLTKGSLRSLWVSNEHVFAGASVFTCAPTIERAGPRNVALRRFATGKFAELKPVEIDCDALSQEETWAPLIAAAVGIPELTVCTRGCVADLADATADFRDQYYGLDGFLVEHDDLSPEQANDHANYPPIVTAGLIDLACCKWGEVPTRILKQKWTAPRVDREAMCASGTLGPWIADRLVPKIIFATQTRILEVFVDVDGRVLPSIPLITITSKNSDDLWRIAAVLASPVNTAIAMQRYAGAALSADAIKLSARQVLTLPLPVRGLDWDLATEALRKAHSVSHNQPMERHTLLTRMAEHMARAYDVPRAERNGLLDWWTNRLNRSQGPRH